MSSPDSPDSPNTNNNNNNNNSSSSGSKLRELISTLPKEERWSSSSDLYQYQGFWYPLIMLDRILSLQQHHFQPLPASDLIMIAALCFAISTRTSNQTSPLITNLPHALIPILEFTHPKSPTTTTTTTTSPRFLSTHLPLASLPESILSSGCKFIYICRDPKDTFVSLWHYERQITNLSPNEESMNLVREFDRFCQGKVALGPYLDHVLGFYKASTDNPDKFLFLKYEEVKGDTVYYVKKLADFMDMSFTDEEEAEGLPQKIAKLCSFEDMSNLEVNKNGKTHLIGPYEVDNSAYFRKGQIGDWKNYLTPEMVDRIDRLEEEKLKGSGFKFSPSN
ncbi:hypothetical protein ACJIZ3_025505 [Penstemon smallii]|uniref:Sulfotransferase n=1 Tax=Penstemon smallii TaxID=265156 RepID=A0ABD3TUR7_9LAMI